MPKPTDAFAAWLNRTVDAALKHLRHEREFGSDCTEMEARRAYEMARGIQVAYRRIQRQKREEGEG